MPEYPDITIYVEALERRCSGKILTKSRIASPFVVRTFDPPMTALDGKMMLGFDHLGKRLVWKFEDDLFLVVHLMIAGRLRWKKPDTKLNRKNGLAAFDFDDGCLVFTEASSKKRASMHLVRGDAALAEHDPGGIDVFSCTEDEFFTAMTKNNHTLKRALTDPKILSGIGNAYSDEILFHAKMSPYRQTQKISEEAYSCLLVTIRDTLTQWVERFRNETGDGFPEKVTAFQPEVCVHGKFKEPCVVCGPKIQRVRRASNEMNYCPVCQTGGKLLSDRSLSRLLKDDWQKTLES
jgi:formamidopyrimidine-DNA glycosylase